MAMAMAMVLVIVIVIIMGSHDSIVTTGCVVTTAV